MKVTSAFVIGGSMLGALCLLVTICLPSLRAARCDMSTLGVRRQLASWLQAPLTPVPWEAWYGVRQTLTEASKYCDDTPLYQVELAKLNALRAAQSTRSWPIRDMFYRRATGHFRAALKNRPLSATTLASLAQSKAYISEFDAEYERALSLSIRFGQNEPDVQLTALNAGFIGWKRLSPRLKQQLTLLYGSTLMQQSRAAQEMLRSYPEVVISW